MGFDSFSLSAPVEKKKKYFVRCSFPHSLYGGGVTSKTQALCLRAWVRDRLENYEWPLLYLSQDQIKKWDFGKKKR